jgi:2-haloacid dehalogenase
MGPSMAGRADLEGQQAVSRYSWIVFDADGTLFDFEHAERAALQRTLRSFGVELTARLYAAYREISIDLWSRFERGEIDSQRLRIARFEQLIGDHRLDVNPSEVSDHYIHSLGGERRLLPGAGAIVEHLASGFRLVLATNGIADVQRSRFEGSAIRPYFADIVISDEIGVAKPDPGYFDEVFARMGNPARSEVLMVGDGLSSDIAGGAAYGIDTCWFNPESHPNGARPRPTYEIRRLTDVLGILEGTPEIASDDNGR